LAVNRELDRFLESVERRAFVKARLATGNEQEALDIVQDAMFKLVKSYGNKAAEEWPPLFHRILQSRITDWYRRQGTKNRLFAWLSKSPQDGHGEYVSDPPDPIDSIDGGQAEPWEHLSGVQIGEALQSAIGDLPLRQQQAFMLRQWDGLSVKDTARTMGCSQGSVKTHCARALANLKHALQQLGIETHLIDGRRD
jgi:RNA polymerase sigma-70 factor (ECF subfamily)